MFSPEKSSKSMVHLAGFIIPALTLYELSKFSFRREIRDEVIIRDVCCQLLDCHSTEPLVIHHLIPESFSNYSYGRQHIGSCGEYVNHFRKIKKTLTNELTLSQRSKFNNQLKRVLRSPMNAITFCMTHHNQLHKDRLKTNLLLNPCYNHSQRPLSLELVNLDIFLTKHIISSTSFPEIFFKKELDSIQSKNN